MGRDDTSEEDGELEFVQYLLTEEKLQGPAEGIAKSVVAKQSKEHLSELQLLVYNKHIIEAHKIVHCKQCSETISWADMVVVLESCGYCPDCQYKREDCRSEECE